MFVRRLAAAGLLAAAAVPAVPAAALAHGAPVTPISRTAACGGNGSRTPSAACVAARAATGGRLGAYDNLRLAGVGGKDRQRVPDGRLCSGGLDAYRGLDLARDDFPATEVTAGTGLAVTYRGTIPHRGSFRIFLTKPGYDPGEKLTWDDLGADPLAEITDPPLSDGAYRMRVRLPERTGRHILYVVWETSSTPDTYYSCSDLVFPEPVDRKAATGRPVAEPAVTKPRPAAPSAAEEPAVPGPAAEEPAVPDPAASEPAAAGPAAHGPAAGGSAATRETAGSRAAVAASQDDTMVNIGHWLILGALTTGALVAAGAGLRGMRRRGNG